MHLIIIINARSTRLRGHQPLAAADGCLAACPQCCTSSAFRLILVDHRDHQHTPPRRSALGAAPPGADAAIAATTQSNSGVVAGPAYCFPTPHSYLRLNWGGRVLLLSTFRSLAPRPPTSSIPTSGPSGPDTCQHVGSRPYLHPSLELAALTPFRLLGQRAILDSSRLRPTATWRPDDLAASAAEG